MVKLMFADIAGSSRVFLIKNKRMKVAFLSDMKQDLLERGMKAPLIDSPVDPFLSSFPDSLNELMALWFRCEIPDSNYIRLVE